MHDERESLLSIKPGQMHNQCYLVLVVLCWYGQHDERAFSYRVVEGKAFAKFCNIFVTL